MKRHPDDRVSPLRSDDPPWIGPYRLVGRLGTGGMGTVYLGDRDDTPVAVKVIRPDLAADDEFRQRFRMEVRRAQQVPPFCTAEVLDADPDHDPPYLVVEYVDGPSLSAVVAERGSLSPANLHGVAIGVATALAAIHGAGVIHRDLKPANVLLAPGSPKVIDFGIARALEVTSQITRSDIMMGSVSYMAPERIDTDPGVPIGTAADIFAWGAVVAYAGTGRMAFQGDSPTATAVQIVTQPPELYDLAPPLRDLVEACLAKDPTARPTARELLDLLLAGTPGAAGVGAALEGQPELRAATRQVQQVPRRVPPPDEAPTVVGTGSRRWPRGSVAGLLVAVAAVVALAVVLGLTVFTDRPQKTGHVAALSGPLAASASTASAPPGSTPAGTASLGSTAPRPVGSRTPVTLTDDLSTVKSWPETTGTEGSCRYQNGILLVSRDRPGFLRCTGPSTELVGDQTVTVDAILGRLGACASIWFLSTADAGYQFSACGAELRLHLHRRGEQKQVGAYTLNKPIPLGKATRIGIRVQGSAVDLLRDQFTAVRLPLHDEALLRSGGGVTIGGSGDATDSPPYEVAFGHIDVRTL